MGEEYIICGSIATPSIGIRLGQTLQALPRECSYISSTGNLMSKQDLEPESLLSASLTKEGGIGPVYALSPGTDQSNRLTDRATQEMASDAPASLFFRTQTVNIYTCSFRVLLPNVANI